MPKLPTKKTVMDFLSIQKTFFFEVACDYFRPLKGIGQLIGNLFGIVMELPKQMFKSASMSNAAYEAEQDEKLNQERRQGLVKEKEEEK